MIDTKIFWMVISESDLVKVESNEMELQQSATYLEGMTFDTAKDQKIYLEKLLGKRYIILRVMKETIYETEGFSCSVKCTFKFIKERNDLI